MLWWGLAGAVKVFRGRCQGQELSEHAGVIEGHDNGNEAAGSSPSGSSPPHHLNLVAVAGWAQACNRTIGAPAVLMSMNYGFSRAFGAHGWRVETE